MAYGESNDHFLDDVTCPVVLFGTDYIIYCHSTFGIDNTAWNYRKTANIIEKTSVHHTVNGTRPLFHTSKTAKMIKVILLSSTLTF